ncbi:MAG: MogA/MoaB family molybdenum cofactor biosynthesis protein [Candidatus Adiutrix sp.]
MKLMYKAAILVASTKGALGQREDLVTPLLTHRLVEAGFNVVSTIIVTDNREQISQTLTSLIDSEGVDLVLTSGGTGLSPSDVTPEATEDVAHRLILGLAEAMRAAARKFTPYGDLSRAIVAQRGQSMIVNLPGSPKGAVENLETVLPALFHALDKIKGDLRDCAR